MSRITRRLALATTPRGSDTLGRLAYEAYWRGWQAPPLPWEALYLVEQRAWNKAARAVQAAVQAALAQRTRTGDG